MNGFAKAIVRMTVTAVILLAAAFCRADGAPQSGRPMENRFLFVIDTSSSMRSRTNGIENAVAELLASDMHGEFRKGDTLGVWTYNERLHSDFPMQVWSPENKVAITGDVLRFLRHQHYEKRAHLDKVLSAIGQVMENSDRLTVIFMYDGTEMIRGTQFDADINELQKKYAPRFRSTHLPVVMILAVRNGQAIDYTINHPGSMTVPHSAIDVPPPPTNAPPPEVVAVPLPTNAAPAEPRPPPRRIEIVMSGTNSVTRTMTQTESDANNRSFGQANIVMTTIPPSQPPQAPAVAALVAVEPVASNAAPQAAKPEPQAPEPISAVAQPEPPTVLPATLPKTQPASAPTPSPTAVPAPSPGPVLPRTPAPAASPAPAPMAVAVASTGQQAALFVIAFSLLTIAVALVVLLVRRFRGGPAASLISQSIDRGR